MYAQTDGIRVIWKGRGEISTAFLFTQTLWLAEALEVRHFTLAQEFERIADIRIIDQTQQVVVGCARFLLCCNRISTTSCFSIIWPLIEVPCNFIGFKNVNESMRINPTHLLRNVFHLVPRNDGINHLTRLAII